MSLKIGLICGSGLDNATLIEDRQIKSVDTPFGKPSDDLVIGKIHGVDCVLLPRHGKEHNIPPTYINFRANIFALRMEGCTHIIVTSACGSLQDNIKPGQLVFIDQFIDRTTQRVATFYQGNNNSGVLHFPLAEPFCPKIRELLKITAKELGYSFHAKGTAITIDGPRYSTRAESKMYNWWGAHVINMTLCPEVCLAREAGMGYAAIGMITDYDSFKDDVEAVTVNMVMQTVQKCSQRTLNLILKTIELMKTVDWTENIKNNQDMVENNFQSKQKVIIRPGVKWPPSADLSEKKGHP
ncbi:unnamed protein product [Gordionus sp. m RMFG-2023]|uniref:S-methyl-5'-thioadenosine phosphorylase-like n=1 Tax=Gordionus sp. m RMFG-2023 TaxID=3053472 RepID=UPI0030E09704